MKAILEMEAPNSCIECQLSCIQSSIRFCIISNKDCKEPYKNRNDDCPLKIEEID